MKHISLRTVSGRFQVKGGGRSEYPEVIKFHYFHYCNWSWLGDRTGSHKLNRRADPAPGPARGTSSQGGGSEQVGSIPQGPRINVSQFRFACRARARSAGSVGEIWGNAYLEKCFYLKLEGPRLPGQLYIQYLIRGWRVCVPTIRVARARVYLSLYLNVSLALADTQHTRANTHSACMSCHTRVEHAR